MARRSITSKLSAAERQTLLHADPATGRINASGTRLRDDLRAKGYASVLPPYNCDPGSGAAGAGAGWAAAAAAVAINNPRARPAVRIDAPIGFGTGEKRGSLRVGIGATVAAQQQVGPRRGTVSRKS